MQRKKIHQETVTRDASKLKVGIVVSDYYAEAITDNLLKGALEVLRDWKVSSKNITIVRVPGSFEIPFGCLTLLKKKKYDALIALGCIIKGETDHDQYIALAVTQGIMDIIVSYGVPIGFGVLTPNTMAQAKARSTGTQNKGREATVATLQSALL